MLPFKSFLLLVGKVPSTTDACPAQVGEPQPAEVVVEDTLAEPVL